MTQCIGPGGRSPLGLGLGFADCGPDNPVVILLDELIVTGATALLPQIYIRVVDGRASVGTTFAAPISLTTVD